MSNPDAYEKTIQQWLTLAGSEFPPGTTFKPNPPELSRKATLEALGLSTQMGEAAGVELHEAIGKGGMATVHRGQQRTLGRDIAVKVQNEDIRSDTVTGVLHEAWLTGALEHPNIVPIYDLIVDSSAKPMVLMRRIEGITWNRLIRKPELLEERFEVRDPFEWHLRIFLQVCNAVDYAHSVGVIHRDIKPDNVMIGGHGEVYLLDWGIATAKQGPLAERLAKLASDALAGTPCYLAPEMLLGESELIDERTDIYLLAATLYHAVVGRPPHPGKTVSEVFDNVANAPVVIPSSLPHELAGIFERALDRDPERRPQSVRELRGAIETFLTHISSNKLTDVASEALNQLFKRIDDTNLDDPEARAALYTLYTSCRSAYEAALHLWPESPTARAGLFSATEAMLEAELEGGTARAAASLLAQIDSPPAELSQRVNEAVKLERSQRAEMERLASKAAGLSTRHGARSRSILTLVIGICYGIWAAYSEYSSIESMIVADIIGLMLCGVFFFVIRNYGMNTTFNKRALFILVMVFSVQVLRRTVALTTEIPIDQLVVQDSLLHFMTVIVASVALDLRLWPVALGYGARHLSLIYDPELYIYATSSSHIFFGLWSAYIWWPRKGRRSEKPLVPVDSSP